MYTGQLIEELVQSVERAELQALVRTVTAKWPASAEPIVHPYVYGLNKREMIEVA